MMAREEGTTRSDLPFAEAAAALAATAGALLAQGRTGEADAKDIATVLGAVARLYAARVERDGAAFPPVERDALTATETVTLVSELLRAADLNVFDLAMWFRRAG
jgi:uncharacterized protein YcfJ